ncbi:Type I modular polyketide synthase [Mycobacterium tuberculosis]|nr:Type I modular polyketide synthase [Mycobacterium tuberculosis]
MDEVLGEFEEIVASVPAAAPRIRLVSTLTGTELADEATQASYWVRQVREAVRFGDAVEFLAEQGASTFLDVSPDGVLTSMITGVLPESRVVPTLRKDIDEPRAVTQAAAGLYTAGVGIDWPAVLGTEGVRPDVVPPPYAFEHTRYWVEPPPRIAEDGGPSEADKDFWDLVARADIPGVAETLGAADAGERQALAGAVPLLARWRGRGRLARSRYQVDWELQRDLPSPQAPVAHLAGSWLLVTSPRVAPGLADALHTALSAHAPQLKTVDLETCEGWSAEQWAAFDGVLSLLGCAGDTAAEAEPGVSVGVAETLRLLTACTAAAAGNGSPSSPRVWVLTRGGTDAPGGAEPDPWSWQLWGLGRVAALDCPDVCGGLIDLPEQPEDAEAVARLVHVLADGTRDQVALRPDGVWSARLVRVPEPPPGAPDPWRARGTVLVTGAGGALGGRVARWAAERGARRVVLASRRGEQAPGSAELAADLRELGAEPLFAACDVADRVQVRDLLARCGDELSSVFHIAGAPGLTPLAGPGAVADPAGWSRIAAGKAAGAWWLDRELGDRDLDAFVVFSSIAGVWGSGGQGAYAAANAFLDGLMSARRSAGRGLASGTAIAWGPWDGGGMADGETGEYLAKRGLRTLDPDLALAALEQALTGHRDRACTVVADVDWSVFAPAFTLTRPAPLLEGVAEAAAALDRRARAEDAPGGETDGALAARLAELSAEDGHRELLELVRTQAARVLGHASPAAIAADGAFNDLGFDSLTAVELRNLLSRATGAALPPTLVFDHPNPAAVAEFLRGALLPEAVDPADEALARLGRLESALGELAGDDPARELVIRRLQAALAGLGGAGGRGPASPARRGGPGPDGAASTADRLRAAGSDELLDFIDKELGRSK